MKIFFSILVLLYSSALVVFTTLLNTWKDTFLYGIATAISGLIALACLIIILIILCECAENG